MIKFLILTILILPFQSTISFSETYQKRGFIKNLNGEKCWYTQMTDQDNYYFNSNLQNIVGILTFDKENCMHGDSVDLDINKRMINNIISRWYSHNDAMFQTDVSSMYNTSRFQKKGKCIQSKTYPSKGITIDYKINNNSITEVIHGMSIGSCKN